MSIWSSPETGEHIGVYWLDLIEEKRTHLRKSLVGCAEWTLHQLFTATLNVLSVMTRNAADHLALKPTATIMHAMKPNKDRNARPMLHLPWKIKPRKRKMRRTRPARRKLKADEDRRCREKK